MYNVASERCNGIFYVSARSADKSGSIFNGKLCTAANQRTDVFGEGNGGFEHGDELVLLSVVHTASPFSVFCTRCGIL